MTLTDYFPKTKVAEGCDPDDRACAIALRKLTDRALEIRWRKPSPTSRNLITATELLSTRWPTYPERLIADPMLEAMNGAIKEIGRYLFHHGGLDRMERVAERAACPRSRWYSARGSYIDHKWDGIGDDAGGRWFC